MLKTRKSLFSAMLCFAMVLCLSVGAVLAMPTKAFAASAGEVGYMFYTDADGKNPRTGEKVEIPASKSPVFKAGKVLKDAVNI